MVLFGKMEEKFTSEFLVLLEERLGREVVRPLYSYFGDDLFLILSLFEGMQRVNFPSLKVLRQMQLKASCFVLYKEFCERGCTWVEILDKSARTLQIKPDRVERYLAEYNLDAGSFQQKSIMKV